MYQKRQYVREPKMRKAANGAPCMVKVSGVCNGNPETTVLAHIDSSEFGKGTGIKSDDSAAAFACSSCHDWLALETKVPAHERLAIHYKATIKTHTWMLVNGVLKT